MAKVEERQRNRRRAVGTSSRKVDSREKVRGEARYASDLDDDAMLYGAVVRSNQTHARIESVDGSAAEAIDGVQHVVPRTELLGQFDDKVRHYGDVVAAVVADDPETADRAADAVSVELDPLEGVFDPREAVLADAPTVQTDEPVGYEEIPHSFDVQTEDYEKNIDDYHFYEVGDVDSAMAEADLTLEETYRTPRVNHCNLDTHACVAEWEDEHLAITETITSPHPGRESIAAFLELDEEQVTLRMPPAGSSSFGGQALPKLSLEPVAATLARLTGSPVKLWFDRQEDFIATETRHPCWFTIRMGVSDAGEMVALDIHEVADTGAYPNHIGHVVLSNGEERPLEMYDVPNYRYEGVAAYTNNVVGGEYRGIGSTQVGYALDSHVDEVCREAGLDPVEFRRRNFVTEGHQPPNLDNPLESCGAEACLDRGKETFDRLSGNVDNPELLVGRGFAAATHTTGSVMPGDDSSEALVELSADGTVTITSTAIDQGQGSDTALSQIVSNETGIALSDIAVDTPSTADDIEGDQGSIAARTTWIVGSATLDATENLLAALGDRAGTEVEAIEGSTVHLADGGSVSLDQVFDGGSLERRGRAVSDLRPPGYGVHFAEVAVDPATGHVDVRTYVAAQDVGFAINPALVEGQLEGSVCHGIEFSLFSELRLDNGHPQNANLADYPVISPWEMPDEMACEIIESNEESGPYGAKGVGTPAQPPVAPAILNAVRDAVGTRLTDLPVSNETVLEAVEER